MCPSFGSGRGPQTFFERAEQKSPSRRYNDIRHFSRFGRARWGATGALISKPGYGRLKSSLRGALLRFWLVCAALMDGPSATDELRTSSGRERSSDKVSCPCAVGALTGVGGTSNTWENDLNGRCTAKKNRDPFGVQSGRVFLMGIRVFLLETAMVLMEIRCTIVREQALRYPLSGARV